MSELLSKRTKRENFHITTFLNISVEMYKFEAYSFEKLNPAIFFNFQ